jgi:nitrogen fixation/metabolism regulation signal transduction histidine kinase
LQQSELLPKLLITALISIIFTSLFSVWLSHRLSGPIVKLINHLKKVGNGEDVPDLRFRKNDFFMELPELINTALKKRK